MQKMKRLTIITLIAVVIGGFAWKMTRIDPHHAPARVEWKNQALADLQGIEIGEDKPDFGDLHEGWFSQRGLVMKDGSWIAFRARCHKEDPRIEDIFIGRASDGKWYYSTYHFCINAVTILMDDQPESLNSFIKQAHLVEFDGRSDDCLRVTWPLE